MGKPQQKKPSAEENNDVIPSNKVGMIQINATRQEYSGPIPPPEIIKKYEDIYKGVAQAIFEMAQSQAKHRQELEK